PWIVGDAAPKIANGQRTHLRLDVTIHNRAVGHAFPGGVQDTQDTWLEVLVMDGSGRVIASAGEGHTDAPDPTAYVLRSTPLTDAGLPEGFHRVARFRAMGWNHTIGPRATRIVQYDLPWEGPVPERFSVQLTLRHRRHHQAFGDFACAAQQSPRGRDFGTDDTTPIDACAPFPITTLTHRTLRFGPTEPQANLVERLRRYADATLDGPLEYLGQGERIVEHALHRGPAPAERGALLATAGAMAARQGRLETALERIAEAESLLGSHPYLERVRGQAFARVWRWSEAATHFKRATELAPGDSSLWTERAQAEVSIGDSTSALASVHRGLALVPRNGELLRLLHGATESPEALETFLAFRGNDRAHVLREECDRAVPGCQATRQPIVRIPLRRPLH
ncbi:MAG: hypothetical protein KC416_13635, partial [Myxococcales bacterium]|nr:hypothetical protein [Myxococcales bacterium]